MEQAKLDWKTFTARRRLDVSMWLKSKKFKKYEDLKEWCESKDMVPPEKEEVKKHFLVPKKPKKVEVLPVLKEVKEEAPKEEDKPTVAKTRRGRPKKKVDIEE